MTAKSNTAVSRKDEAGVPGRRHFLLALSAFALSLSLRFPTARAQASAFLIIVHPDNPLTSAPRDFLEEAFLRKTTRWPDDEPMRPVDLPARAPVRAEFSERILQRSVEAVKNYWQQRIFSGRGVPPPELDTDAAVVAYVARNRGAIGYVSSGAELKSTKAIEVR